MTLKKGECTGNCNSVESSLWRSYEPVLRQTTCDDGDDDDDGDDEIAAPIK
jgi:hypothetical protein